MTAQIINGKEVSLAVQQEIKQLIASLEEPPKLAVVLVGDDAASAVYVRSKAKTCEALGMGSRQHILSKDTDEASLLDLISDLNKDVHTHGILVQLPLPSHLDEEKILAHIDPAKDVDGFHPINAGLLSLGSHHAVVPCTPLGCRMLIKNIEKDLSGKNAVVIGRSNIVGKPMANLLLQESCTVTIAHSRTQNLKQVCLNADILVAAVGRAEMITADYIKEGAIVIDVGINRVEDNSAAKGYQLTGDVDFASAITKAAHITPVPGGVGPMTIACLMVNTCVCYFQQKNQPLPKRLKELMQGLL